MQATFPDTPEPTVTIELTRHEATLLSCLRIAFDEYSRVLEAKGSSFCNRAGVNELNRFCEEIRQLSNQLHANDFAHREDED